jgi:heat shock protein HtpX
MKYIGLQAQQTNNNIKSILLLIMFPLLMLALVYAFLLAIFALGTDVQQPFYYAYYIFIEILPYVLLVVGVWFVIAYFANTLIIKKATNSRPLERKENKRVYNLVENLCMANGMPMPKVNIIYDDSLNAFASGINKKTYTVTLSKGIIDKLNDEELEGVIAHELSHIRNNDVRLLIISIVFVGIFSFLVEAAWRSAQVLGRGSRNSKGNPIIFILLILVLAAIGYFFSRIFKLAISRKREYLADASAAEMTRRPWALASALRKVSQDSMIEAVEHDDVAQLFIEHPGEGAKEKRVGFSGLFATHPPIEKRIQILEQF